MPDTGLSFWRPCKTGRDHEYIMNAHTLQHRTRQAAKKRKEKETLCTATETRMDGAKMVLFYRSSIN